MSQMLQTQNISVLEVPFATSVAKTVKCFKCGCHPRNGIVLTAAKIDDKIGFYCTDNL